MEATQLVMRALAVTFVPENRCCCRTRAAWTRSRSGAEGSPSFSLRSSAMESAGGASVPVRAPDQPTRIVPRGQQPEGVVCGDDSGGDPVFEDRFHAQLTVGPIDHTVHLLPLTISERRTVIHAGEARADVDAGMAAPDLLADVPQAHPPGPQAPGKIPLEHGQVSGHALLLRSGHPVKDDVPTVELTP